MTFSGFNHSLWHSLLILFPLELIGTCIVVANAICRKHVFYHFDSKNNLGSGIQGENGEFGSHFSRYQDLAKLIIALSVGAVAFLVNVLVGMKPPVADFVAKMAEVTPIAVGLFGASITFLIFFLATQTFWYEEYSHSPKHDTYKAWKYALCNVLGWIGLISFLLAFGWLAVNVFS